MLGFEFLLSTLSVAVGIVLGTLLTWGITYLLMRKYVGTFIKLVSNQPEFHRILKDVMGDIGNAVSSRKDVMPYEAARYRDIREKTPS